MTGDRAISTIFTRGINDFELPLTLQMWAEKRIDCMLFTSAQHIPVGDID